MTRHTLTAFLLLSLSVTTGCGFISAISGKRSYEVRSESMLPTLKVGSTVTAELIDHYTPRTGDVIVVRPPDSWSSNGAVLTRVIGIPGSTVRCCDDEGRVQLDGRSLTEPYIIPAEAYQLFGPVTIPPGRIWIMGDNRALSLDSRWFNRSLGDGTIPAENVIGVVKTPK